VENDTAVTEEKKSRVPSYPIVYQAKGASAASLYWIDNKFSPILYKYRGAVKSLARPTSRYILFDDENISFDASLVIYIYIYK